VAERPSYKRSGVDIEAGDRAVELISKHALATNRPEVLTVLGGFAGAFDAGFAQLKEPVLLAATDGVGSKLLIAQTLDRHDTVGLDLVAMVVDDLVCHGAEPLFLLDYIACGNLVPERIEAIVAGIAEGCRIAGCALLGGETAEHPGVMEPDAYDLAAFAVGVADKQKMWGPERVRDGDAVIGIASSGLHSNGYSLVRRIILEHDLDLASEPKELGGLTLGDALLEPTTIYAPALLGLPEERVDVHAAAHVTGGGIAANLARVIPAGFEARLDRGSWPLPAIFAFLQKTAQIDPEEMAKAFNLGLGMTMVITQDQAEPATRLLRERGLDAYTVGRVYRGKRGVVLEERST
jgi:phosphoribosylformylglycinamidine cyclo-ligase